MKRIVEKQCPICGKVTYMVVDAENYDQVMEYMVALYFNTKRKLVQEALPFLDKFGREFIKSGYCRNAKRIYLILYWRTRAAIFLVQILIMKYWMNSLRLFIKLVPSMHSRLIKQILYQCIRSSILPMHLKFGSGCRWTILVRSFWFPKMRKGNLDI